MKNILNRPVTPGSLIYKIGILFVLLLAVAVLAPAFSYLNVVFGWTNPGQNPPGGSGLITAYNGNIGINTATPGSPLEVNGVISAMGHKIIQVLTPTAGTDVANKSYVDANGGGGGASLVLYGTAGNGSPPSQFTRAAGSLAAGCRGVYGGIFSANCNPAGIVAAGTNAPACPAGWTEAYAGYGPLNSMFTWYGTANQDPSGNGGDPNENDVPDTAVIGTDSICSTQAYAFMQDNSYSQNGNGAGYAGGSAVLSACNNQGCNTCRVCVK